jgi:hypothetical protein
MLFIIAVLTDEKNLLLPARQLLMGHCLLIMWASLSHSNTHHSVGLLWTNDQPDAETFTRHHNTHKIQISTPQTRFESTTPTPTNERPQTHTLDLAATGIGKNKKWLILIATRE